MNPVLKICKRCKFYYYKPDIAQWHMCKAKDRELVTDKCGRTTIRTFAEDMSTGIQYGKQTKRKEPPWDFYFTGEDFGIPQFCPYYLEQLMANQSFVE